MNNVALTHVTVKDTPPPGGREVIGIFRTFVPDYAPNKATLLEEEVEEVEAETKVVRRGRRPRVRVNEGAETK